MLTGELTPFYLRCRSPLSSSQKEKNQMALLSPRLLRLPHAAGAAARWCGGGFPRCHATAAGVAANSPSGLQVIRWGSTKLQGSREEMEDDVIVRPHSLLNGFSFAAVFDGHAGFSAVEFLRDELYKECAATLEGGAVLSTKNLEDITDSVQRAFATVDAKLSTWLEQMKKENDSGATATVVFVRNDFLVVSHLGDSCLVISRGGRAQVLTNFHRPYGSNRASLEEIKRIRAAGGWIVDGRICGDISVSRAFGDIRFKTRKNEMLAKGVKEGRWTEKFISRIQFKGDLLISSPDVSLVDLGPDAEFILLASDGLLDYMKSSDAVTFVRDQLRQHGDVQLACEALGQAALDRRSQDNVSIVIADLGRTNWQELPIQRPNLFMELSQAFATVGVVSIVIWISTFLAVQ